MYPSVVLKVVGFFLVLSTRIGECPSILGWITAFYHDCYRMDLPLPCSAFSCSLTVLNRSQKEEFRRWATRARRVLRSVPRAFQASMADWAMRNRMERSWRAIIAPCSEHVLWTCEYACKILAHWSGFHLLQWGCLHPLRCKIWWISLYQGKTIACLSRMKMPT